MDRFHPYQPQFRRKRPLMLHSFSPALNPNYNAFRLPPVDDKLSEAYHRLCQLNIEQGKLCTYNHETSSWVEVVRPQNVRYKKAHPIAASSLDRIWGKYSSPFFCPHRRRSGQAYDPLILSLGARHDGGLADIYRALDHVCSFVIVVPPIKPRVMLITAEDQHRFRAEQERGDGDDDDDTPPSSDPSSSSMTGYQPSSLQASMSSVTSLGRSPAKSKSTSTSTIDELTAEAMLCPDPRYTGPCSMSTGRHAPPHPIPIGSGTVLDRTVHSYYSRGVTDARKFLNTDLMSYIQEITAFCTVNDDPSLHPAWDPDTPPVPLRLYDQRVYTKLPGQYQHPSAVLVQTAEPSNPGHEFGPGHPVCVGCMNHFSPDGYEHHRRDGLCTNHPDLVPIKECPPFEASIHFRSFCDKRPEFRGETLNSAIGTALLQWNSRLGVPTDVWITASTAVVHCTLCDLTRSFPAHVLHLDGEDCSDPGQAVVSANGFDSDP
ncbi:hypothetical protein B0H14DRAFT_2604457 [Mycena olivaceomarginata]|nr:hypothetical protein B0H14DRAFT_2604457 [Mycena olivaceomarginata]